MNLEARGLRCGLPQCSLVWSSQVRLCLLTGSPRNPALCCQGWLLTSVLENELEIANCDHKGASGLPFWFIQKSKSRARVLRQGEGALSVLTCSVPIAPRLSPGPPWCPAKRALPKAEAGAHRFLHLFHEAALFDGWGPEKQDSLMGTDAAVAGWVGQAVLPVAVCQGTVHLC